MQNFFENLIIFLISVTVVVGAAVAWLLLLAVAVISALRWPIAIIVIAYLAYLVLK